MRSDFSFSQILIFSVVKFYYTAVYFLSCFPLALSRSQRSLKLIRRTCPSTKTTILLFVCKTSWSANGIV